jgi:hypothetical protein
MARSTNKCLIVSAAIVIAASLLAFGAHVLLQYVENSIIAERGEELSKVQMLKFPYPWHIDVMGAATAIVPTLLYYGLLFLVWEKIPLRSWISKGIVFSLVVLEIKGEIFRNVVMSISVGMPAWYPVVSRLDVWIPNLLLGLICAAGIHYLKNRNETEEA